jgi:hypothetical protein
MFREAVAELYIRSSDLSTLCKTSRMLSCDQNRKTCEVTCVVYLKSEGVIGTAIA